ncbi:hypothetical protein [Cellulomonas sp. WB94]|uniref:hypothetical protein n=1 Tax=Cellulomonas sp. WB94 TaxID=2173174 RepID=UPI0011B21E17|nr:hypothetical protein [Cellulomonas sp. WB94]
MGQTSWAARRQARRTRRALQFTGRLDHRLTTPPDVDGRPGWELLAPSRSPYIAVVTEDGSRSEFVVILGPRSHLLAVCFGPVSVKGSPQELAAVSIDAIQAMGAARCTLAPTACRLVGLPAVGYTMTFTSGAVLQEWKLAHEGWVYGFGVLTHDDEGLAAHQLAREALDTFRWIPPVPRAAVLGG